MSLRICRVSLLSDAFLCPLVNGQTDYVSDRQLWERLAERGDATAQYRLASFYQNGWGVTADYEIAAVWLRRAADQGQSDAQFNLGLLYLKGQGVREDAKQAAAWFRKSAEAGNKLAQCNLGAMYEQGQGVPRTRAKLCNGTRLPPNRATPWPNTIRVRIT